MFFILDIGFPCLFFDKTGVAGRVNAVEFNAFVGQLPRTNEEQPMFPEYCRISNEHR